MPRNEQPSLRTGGGAATNNVTTGGGDFTGRNRIAYTINFFGPIAVEGKTAQSPWETFDWGKAEQTYRDSLIRHYGSLRVIGATVDSPLDNVFTDVLIQCLQVATVTDRQAILNGLLEPPVPSVEEKLAAVASAKKAGKPWWKLW